MLLDTARHDPLNNVINNHEGRGGVGVRRWRGKGRGGGEEGEKWSVEIDRQGGEVGGEGDTEKDREKDTGREEEVIFWFVHAYSHTCSHVHKLRLRRDQSRGATWY